MPNSPEALPISRPQSIINLHDLQLLPPQDDEHFCEQSPHDQVDLLWVDLRYSVTPKKPSWFSRIFRLKDFQRWDRKGSEKEILHGIMGYVQPGEILAVMGGSGSGKSTLLNVLSGRVAWGKASGHVTVNGQHRDIHKWCHVTSYVEQKDELDPVMTVREILEFNVNIKLSDQKYTTSQKQKKVERLLDSLGLRYVAEHRISTLSDGQRKLLAIGIEICSERRMIFLDEPTTGLDTSTAFSLVQRLRYLADKYQLTIIVSIHQPRYRKLALFDQILLLSQGNALFFGKLEEMIQHVIKVTGEPMTGHENPADYGRQHFLSINSYVFVVMDMTNIDWRRRNESQIIIDRLARSWTEIILESDLTPPDQEHRPRLRRRNSSLNIVQETKRSVANRSRSTLFNDSPVRKAKNREDWPNTFWTEFTLLTRRYIKEELRMRNENIFLFIEFICIAIFYGFVFFRLTTDNFGGFQSRLGLCSQISRLILFVISSNLGNVFLKARKIIVRERESRTYRISAAFLAKIVALLPFRMFCTACFATIIYFIAGLRLDGITPFLIYFFFTQLIAISMTGIGLIITSYCDTLSKSVVAAIFLGDLFNVFGGTLVLSPSIPGVLRWIRFLDPLFLCNQALVQNEVQGLVIGGLSGEYYLDLFFQNQITIMWAAGGLMISTVFYYLLAYILLRMSTKPRFNVI